jgi:preprotein translocase subunit Sec63
MHSGVPCDCKDCKVKVRTMAKQKNAFRHVTLYNCVLVLLWLLLLYLMWQMPSFQTKDLAQFKPYEVLGVEKDAPEDEIKRVSRS